MKILRKLSAALAAFLLGGCAAVTPIPVGDILVYGSGDYTAINPALYEHGEINSLLFSGLTAYDSENRVVPGLAERWEFDARDNTYTFHLRAGVKWHDGEPFTAEDVRFTLEAVMDPANASEIASNYEDILKIDTPDNQTVKIKLDAPNVAMLGYLSVGLLPQHLLEGKDLLSDPFNQAPVGTGPYRFTNWDMGQSITMTANEDYYAGAPKIETVIFQFAPDVKARAMQLLAGELDLAQITPQDIAQVAQDERFVVWERRTSDYRGVLYNFAHPLFSANRELPAALSYAVDRRSVVESALLGHGEPAWSPLQRGPYVNGSVERYDYAPAKSRSLLEAADWKPGADGVYEKDGQRLAFTITCAEGDQVRVDMAKICAQQFREIGADVDVAVASRIDWAGQAAYLIGWGSPFDPDDHTYKVFGTDKGSNFSAYTNPEVDRLLTAARATADEAERQRLYKAFQSELTSDPPYTLLAYADAVFAADRRLTGVTPETLLGHHGVGIFWNVAEWSFAEE